MYISQNLVGKSIAFIGTHVPRRCGIATFTADLAGSLDAQYPLTRVRTLAISDGANHYDYPKSIDFELRDSSPETFLNAAQYIEASGVDLVCLQHEFGIFGGVAGDNILTLLNAIKVPVITTLHTVLRNPNAAESRVLMAIAERSTKLVVMSQKAVELLVSVYNIPVGMIELIPHGIPAMPNGDRRLSKEKLGLNGHRVLLTFGLISADKGLENVIEALPKIVASFPDTLYVIVGQTHPKVKEQVGETYRIRLQDRIAELGLENNVLFVDQYVTLDDLMLYLSAADIYVTPYLKEEQVTSGTLAIAVGSGRATISTPYWHAQEMLQFNRGILVPFRDPHSIAHACLRLFADPQELSAMERRAGEFGESVQWPRIAKRYMRMFETAIESGDDDARVRVAVAPVNGPTLI